MKPYLFVGVPYWLGELKPERTEVRAIKNSGIVEELNASWVDLAPDFSASSDPVIAVNRALAQAVQAHPDHFPVILAADCTSCLGAVKGLENQQPAVLWYDAHGDFNTPETTPSGFLGGMPLAALVGRGNEHLLEGVGLPPLDEQRIIITDARDLDLEEGVNLRASAVTLLPKVSDLLSHPLPDRPLYVHFDTDVVDSSEMPAMSYPTAGGPSLAETEATLKRVMRDGNVAGVLFSLWNDALPGAGIALQGTLRLIRGMLA